MNAEAMVVKNKKTAVNAARILIVEDERIVARSLSKQLTTLGYEVVGSVGSGQEAVQQAGAIHPDLVLMDINLDGPMDGVEAAALISKQYLLPVVYLTAYSNKEILERAKVTEPFGYILKPYEDRELQVVIETALYKHRMERRQQEREQWFVATLRSIGDAVVASDEEGHVTYMNPLAERLTGWHSSEAVGQPLAEVVRLVHEESKQPVESTPDDNQQVGVRSAGIILVSKDKSEKAVEDCATLITDEQGRTIGKVVVFRDVTWRKHLEERYRQSKKLEAIGQLAGGIAHSFNNIMTTVLGHSELMIEGMKPGDRYFASAQEIKRSALRTATLTQKLLTFSRKHDFRPRPIDLNALITALAQFILHTHRGIRLDLSLEQGLGPTRADADQLQDSILTLVRNAYESMPPGERVTIQTANAELGADYTASHPDVAPGSYILLAIADTGIGMSDEIVSHLFEPYFTKDHGVGSGLGLAAVYGFVKQCGGDIEVRSQPKKGTTFRVYLPREERRKGTRE